MLLKIQNSSTFKWTYIANVFEVEELEVGECEPERNYTLGAESGGRCVSLRLSRNQGNSPHPTSLTVMVEGDRAYLMNDDGKTIDKF